MGSKPPLYDFRPFEPGRVAEVRSARELAWAQALAPKPTKRRTTSARSKTPAPIRGVPPEMQAIMRQALANLGI